MDPEDKFLDDTRTGATEVIPAFIAGIQLEGLRRRSRIDGSRGHAPG
jgi:hypothetical protein